MRRLLLSTIASLLGLVITLSPARAAAAVEFVLSNFDVQVNGTTVTYQATVCNMGSTAAGSFELAVYYDLAAAPGCSTAPSQTTTINSLASGMCTIRSFTQVNAPNGAHTGWARADAACAIAENNENNNNAKQQYNVNLPDLVVSNLWIQVSGTNVTYNATVCNMGDLVAAPFTLKLFYDLTSAPDCTTPHSQQTTINSLGSGVCVIRTFNRTGAPMGSYTAWALADGGCAVSEMNEGNNARSENYSVGLPDLVLTNLYIEVTGTDVTYQATVCNIGDSIGSPFSVKLYYDLTSAPDCTTPHSQQTTVASLASGMCTVLNFNRAGAPKGAYTAWALADGACAINETGESNNVRSEQYSVGLPDLVVSNFVTSVLGNTVTYQATVCNLGDDIITAFVLKLYHDLGTSPGCTTAHSQQTTIASLSSGMCTIRTFNQTNVPVGSYTAHVLADGGCVVVEGNETNNSASSSYSVTYSPPDAGPPDGPAVADAGPPDAWLADTQPADAPVSIDPDLPVSSPDQLEPLFDLGQGDQAPAPDGSPLDAPQSGDQSPAPDVQTGDGLPALDLPPDQSDPNPLDAAVDGGGGDLSGPADAGVDGDGAAGTGEAGSTSDAVAGDEGASTSGCDCRVGSTAAGPLMLPLLLLGLALLARRRD